MPLWSNSKSEQVLTQLDVNTSALHGERVSLTKWSKIFSFYNIIFLKLSSLHLVEWWKLKLFNSKTSSFISFTENMDKHVC